VRVVVSEGSSKTMRGSSNRWQQGDSSKMVRGCSKGWQQERVVARGWWQEGGGKIGWWQDRVVAR